MMNQVPMNMLLVQPLQGGFAQPPCIPNVNVSPNVSQYLPFLSLAVANEASMKANMHPGRVYTYNVLSMNNWNNQEFATVVCMAADIMTLGLFKNIYRGPEDGIAAGASQALAAYTSMNIYASGQLQQACGYDISNDANANVNSYNVVAQEVMALRNGQLQQPMQNNFGMQPNYGAQQPMYPQNNQQSYPQNNQQNLRQFGNNSSGGGTVYVNPNVNQPVSNNTGMIARTFAKVADIAPPMVPNQFNNVIQPNVAPLIMSGKNMVWKPTTEQLYPVTVATKTHRHGIRPFEKAGIIYNISYAEQLKDNEMDRAMHSLGYVDRRYISVLPSANDRTRTEAINVNVNGFSKITGGDILSAKETINNLPEGELIDPDIEAKINEITSAISTEAIFEPSMTGLITRSKIAHITATGGCEPCSLHKSFGTLGEPIVLCPDPYHSVVLEKLAKVKTHAEVVDIIDDLLNKLGHTSSDVYLAMRINNFMLDAIHRVLRNNLSIPKDTLDDYRTDVLGLPQYLQDTYSIIHREAYERNEERLLRLLFGSYTGENRQPAVDLLDDKVLNDFETEREYVNVEFLFTNYTLIHLGFHSSELNVTPFNECASLIDNSTPILSCLARAMLKQEREANDLIYRRLVITEDDVIYEISEGWVMRDNITVTELNLK